MTGASPPHSNEYSHTRTDVTKNRINGFPGKRRNNSRITALSVVMCKPETTST